MQSIQILFYLQIISSFLSIHTETINEITDKIESEISKNSFSDYIYIKLNPNLEIKFSQIFPQLFYSSRTYYPDSWITSYDNFKLSLICHISLINYKEINSPDKIYLTFQVQIITLSFLSFRWIKSLDNAFSYLDLSMEDIKTIDMDFHLVPGDSYSLYKDALTRNKDKIKIRLIEGFKKHWNEMFSTYPISSIYQMFLDVLSSLSNGYFEINYPKGMKSQIKFYGMNYNEVQRVSERYTEIIYFAFIVMFKDKVEISKQVLVDKIGWSEYCMYFHEMSILPYDGEKGDLLLAEIKTVMLKLFMNISWSGVEC